jgi:small subunit ribosomal protein S3
LGRKIHPIGFRLGLTKDWFSRWYAEREYTRYLQEDMEIRRKILQELPDAAISRIEIERTPKEIRATIHTARPGIVIGKGGQKVDTLRKELEELTGKRVSLPVAEIRQPDLDAVLVANNIAEQIGKRVSYRRAMKQAILRAMRQGAKGIKIKVSGRLGGAEMARTVWEMAGRVPLHTIRADIDFGLAHAYTTYGRIGVKVWIYKGDILEPPKLEIATAAQASQLQAGAEVV